MSDDKVIHVAHEFVPKLLRRKIEAAIANREAFVEARKKEMVPLLLANRNVYAAYKARKKFSFYHGNTWRGEVITVQEAARVPFDHYDIMTAAMNPFRWSGHSGHKYDQLVWGPQRDALAAVVERIDKGSKWVAHFIRLYDNLKRTPTRRVSVSESVLTSITYWAAMIKE